VADALGGTAMPCGSLAGFASVLDMDELQQVLLVFHYVGRETTPGFRRRSTASASECRRLYQVFMERSEKSPPPNALKIKDFL
jgi:hypothetical protein